MFSNQIQALTAAGFTDQQIQVLCQCELELTHRGPVFYDYQWPPNASDLWGATRYRTNKNGIAGNVLKGRWVFQEETGLEMNNFNFTMNGYSVIPIVEGTLNGDLVKDGDQDVTLTDSRIINAFDRFLPTGKKLVNTNRVLCGFYDKRWNVIQAVCPVDA